MRKSKREEFFFYFFFYCLRSFISSTVRDFEHVQKTITPHCPFFRSGCRHAWRSVIRALYAHSLFAWQIGLSRPPPSSPSSLRLRPAEASGGGALEPEHQTRSIADSSSLPVYDLKTTKADGDHSWFRFSTRDFDQSSITRLDGFELKEHYNPYWVDQNSCKDGIERIDTYVPQRKGASLILRHIAQ